MDGTTDLRRLSDEDLAKAKAAADPALNPLDWENVRAEARRRKVKRREKRLPIMSRVVGGYLLLSSAIGLFAVQNAATTAHAGFYTVVAIVLVLWGVAGVLLVKRRRLGYLMGVAALAFQLPVIDVGGFTYRFRPLYAVVVGLLDSKMELFLGTGTQILARVSETPSTSLAVDIVAAYGIVTLLRAMHRANRAGAGPGR